MRQKRLENSDIWFHRYNEGLKTQFCRAQSLQARDDWVRCIEEVSGHPEETIECDELMEEIELGDGHTIPMARFSFLLFFME